MADKFRLVGSTEEMVHTMNEVQNRMEKAVSQIADKYAKNPNAHIDNSVSRPTGSAYQQPQTYTQSVQSQRSQLNPIHQNPFQLHPQQTPQLDIPQPEQNESSDDELNEYLEDYDEDPELKRIRESRLAQIKAEHQEQMMNRVRGHGTYREVSQDEFLPEVTGSPKVICHFYHKDFERCKIMDQHLEILAPRHFEAKFIKINAEKAPFFVDKLLIRVLPTVLIFIDGITKEGEKGGRIIGFQGLTDGMTPGKEDMWPTYRLARKLVEYGVIDPDLELEEELRNKTMQNRIQIHGSIVASSIVDDEDFTNP